MTIDEIKELIQVVNETGIAQLEVQRGADRVVIMRSVTSAQDRLMPVTGVLPLTVSAAPAVIPASQQVAAAPAASVPVVSDESESDVLVKSPIVGTYYDSPSPDAPKFVKVGDRVEPKQILCIIESMKLMNEIEAETAGIVVAKHIDNGRPVEYGELLFAIRPIKS